MKLISTRIGGKSRIGAVTKSPTMGFGRPNELPMKRILAAILLGLFASHAMARTAPQSIDEALKQAQAEHLPVFADFQAQWCYSCYFMSTHVLTAKGGEGPRH